jgi:type VI secretion system secreted protein VgrG
LALPKSAEFRPQRKTPKPKIYGNQTAVVVCPSGKEIYRDKYCCVKVHFHWDQEGKAKDTNDSSCWIRVACFIFGRRS